MIISKWSQPKNKVKITVNVKALDRFKRKARKKPIELVGFFVGTATYSDGTLVEVNIKDIVYPPVYYGNATFCQFDDRDIPEDFIGTIHSHPLSDRPHLSPGDVHSSSILGEIVYAVYDWSKQGGRVSSELNFYTSGPPIGEIEKT